MQFQCPNIHENSDHTLCEKYRRRLTQGIVKTVQCEQEGDLSPIACEGFNLVLLYYLRKADQKNLKKLTPRLREIIESAVSIILVFMFIYKYLIYSHIFHLCIIYTSLILSFFFIYLFIYI